MKRSADLRVSIGLVPLRRSLRFLQPLKLAPILVSEHYTLKLRLDNLRFQALRDVRVLARLRIKIAGNSTPFDQILEFGDIAARDTTVRSWGPHLMREQGSSDIEVLEAYAGKEQLTMHYQGGASATFLHIYDLEPWSSIVQRLVGVITLLTLLLTILFRLLGR